MDLLTLLTNAGVENASDVVAKVNAKATELKAKILIDEGNTYVPKSRLDDEIGKKKAFKEQLDETTQALNDIKGKIEGQDDLVKKLGDLEKANGDLTTKMQNQTIDTAIKLKALELQAKDKTGADIMAFVDRTKFKLNEDGSVDGLEDALKTLKDSKPYLFDEVQADPQGTGNPGNPGAGASGGKGETGFGSSLAKEYGSLYTNGLDLSAFK